MNIELWLLYVGAVSLLSLTPGPNGLLAITHGAQYGVLASCFTIAGGIVGFMLLMALSMMGLGGLLLASETAFLILKILGAGYLVYLGIRQWHAKPLSIPCQGQRRSLVKGRKLLTQGFCVAIANPKVILFFLAFLPQFVDPSRALLLQLLIMAATFAVIEFLIEVVLAAGSRKIVAWFQHKQGARLFNKLTGGLFVSAGAALALSHR